MNTRGLFNGLVILALLLPTLLTGSPMPARAAIEPLNTLKTYEATDGSTLHQRPEPAKVLGASLSDLSAVSGSVVQSPLPTLLTGSPMPARAVSEPQMAPLRPGALEPLPPGTGFIPPPMDLSHLTGQKMPGDRAPQALPDEFDWRDKDGGNYVTPVKNQSTCGSCYSFAAIGDFESKLLIDSAGTYDFSENNAKECNWKELNNYESPPGTPWGSCNGGNYYMMASLFSQKGTVLETCDPYQASDVACKSTCAYQKTLLDWRIISDGVADTNVLKQYIYDNGPVYTALYADSAQGFDGSYNGSHTFNYTTPGDSTNHAVLIVGWSNDLPPVPGGGTTPADGWIVKNSWGAGWGASGYFYITYGAGNIGTSSSFIHEWQDYNTNGDVWYYDDDGLSNAWGYGNTTGWGLVKFIPSSNTNVTRVEFWTTDETTDVDVYIYDDFNGTTFSNLLASKENNSFGEAGYHSVALDSPLAVTSGDDVIAVVKFTNDSYGYPIAADQNGSHETGRTYISPSGSSGSWLDLGTSQQDDVAIRLRTSTSTTPAPTVMSITPNNGFYTETVHITNLAGNNFQSGATVKLAKLGQPDINASGVTAESGSKIVCDFNLNGAATGKWHVVVTNPDTQSGALPNGFTVKAPGGEETEVYLPLVLRNHPPPLIPNTPVLNSISNPDGDGNYTVSWNAADRADTYILEEDDNASFSSPTTQYTGSNTSWDASGKAAGTYYYRVKASNSVGDSGWSNVESVSVQPSQWITILSENFEGPFPGSTWQVQDNNPASGLYYWGKRDCRSSGGSFSAWSVGAGDTLLSCGSDYPTDVYAWMIYGPFDLSNATAAELIFDWWSDTEYGWDIFFWGASTNGMDYYGYWVSGDHSSWTRGERFDLSAVPTLGSLLGEDQVWIAFVFGSNDTGTDRGSFVDNVWLRKRVSAAASRSERPDSPRHVPQPNQTIEFVELRLNQADIWSLPEEPR